ncbi:MAG: hypothetical protein AB8B86_00095 [Pseudomonadales bacterium]
MKIPAKFAMSVRTLVVVHCLFFTCLSMAATVDVHISNESGDALGLQQTTIALTPKDRSASSPVNSIPLPVEQINTQFRPFITTAQRGADIVFPNRDKTAHHVYSFSAAAQFQSKLYSKPQSHTIRVDKAGVITIGCNIHDWMLSYVYVVDTPHFGYPSSEKIRFEDVSGGSYELSYWHPSMRAPIGKTLEVVEGGVTNAKLLVDVKVVKQPEVPSKVFQEEAEY